MFDFRNGMLGVVIVAIAIAGALFGSYLAGIDTEQVEVTKYSFLADVSGQFSYDESPQYIDYDPSTNYVGYYSDASYSSFDDWYYFATDDVDFVRSASVNNYKIVPKPTLGSESSLDLSTTTVDKVQTTVRYVYDVERDHVTWWGFISGTDKGAVVLKTVIESLQLSTDEWTDVLISLGDEVNWNAEPHQGIFRKTLDLDTILIVPKSKGFVYLASPDSNLLEIQNIEYQISKPYLSFRVNLNTWDVDCYYTPDYTGTADHLRADAMLVCYGDSNDGEGSGYDRLNLADAMTYTPMNQPNNLYLNPNEGVWLKDE